MKDQAKTKEQLISELEEMRQRIAELAAVEAECKRAEEALRESEEKYRGIFDKVPTSIILSDKDGQVIDINPYHITNIGKGKTTRKDYLGKNLVTHPSIVNAGLSEIYARLLKGEPFDLKDVYFPTTTGGTDGYFNVKGVPLLKEGKVIGAIAMHEDITERKRVEKEIRRVQERFSGLYNSSKDAIGFASNDGTLLDINDAFCQLTGYSKKELLAGKKYQELTPEEYHEWEAKLVEGVLTTGKPAEYEKEYVRKDGSRVPILLTVFVVKGEGGEPIGVAAIIKDITDRKRAEEALRESEEKYKSLINNVKLGVFRSTPEPAGKFLEVNPAMVEITGYHRKELLQMNVADLYVYPEERRLVLEEVASGKGKAAKEVRLRKKDGTEIVVLDRKVAVRDNAGRIIYFDGIMEDITERKEAEEALRESEEKYRRLFEVSPIGITTIDMKGVITSCNPAVYKEGGYSEDELVGKHFLKIAPIRVRDIPKYMRIFSSIIRGKVPKPFEAAYKRKDGSIGWTEIHVALLKAYGSKLGVQVLQRDITDRKRAEEREKELQKELNLASRLASVGELAAGVAHEINNPLTGILAFSQRLLRKSTDEKVSRDLEIIHNEARRAAKVVNNLLTFARRREPKKGYSGVNNILQRALELRAYQLKTGNIEVVTNFAPSLPKTKVDFHQIQEVFLNIILNAEQAVAEANRGGKLSIKTREMDGYIRISFTDDGPGIPLEHLDKIFDPFFTTRGKRGGTGLGLSICHGIVERHGGKIYVKSKPGKGATFVVELPLTGEKVKEAKRS